MENPIPAPKTRVGVSLHLNDWPAQHPRARLLLVHGLGEHSGRYATLASELNAIGVLFGLIFRAAGK